MPLEVEGITPDAVRGKSLAEIEKLEVFEGNVKSRLADFFTVSGDAADEIHEWEGDLERRALDRGEDAVGADRRFRATPAGTLAARCAAARSTCSATPAIGSAAKCTAG